MQDYFGYEKTAKGPGDIVSSTMVLVSIGKDAIRLVQNINVRYSRQASFQYELGSDYVWTIAGQSSGAIDMQRSVGDRPFLDPYKPGSPCDVQTITIGKGSGICGMDPGTIVAQGCLLMQVGINAVSNGLTVTDNASWMVGSLSASAPSTATAA